MRWVTERPSRTWVIVRGAGDLATGIIVRLWNSGFRVIALEATKPSCIRRTVALSEAVYEDTATVENVTGRLATVGEVRRVVMQGEIPVVVDPDGAAIAMLRPDVVVDAMMKKVNTSTYLEMAPYVVGVGPGFEVGYDADVVIETKRGHELGKSIWQGEAIANTGIPGEIGGESIRRVVRAPGDGVFLTDRLIGEKVEEGEVIATVDGVNVVTEIAGTLRGLLRSGHEVTTGYKVADVDPRPEAIRYIHTISDKARAIAGGVLEAILEEMQVRTHRRRTDRKLHKDD